MSDCISGMNDDNTHSIQRNFPPLDTQNVKKNIEHFLLFASISGE